jgi:cephalosporin hydroxylase
MQNLQEIFNEIGNLSEIDRGCNDKGGQIHTYLETYDKLFEPFRNGCTFMEIGLALGDSIKLVDRYFENSKIIGVDISVVFTPDTYKNDVTIIEADATKPEFLTQIDGLTFSIINDDASHMEADQIATFELLKHRMKPGGLYIIEDILAIDQNRQRFEKLHDNCEIIDMRHVNGRFDNVLIIYRF